MANPEEERPPFNERAALEELERFKDDIERYRQQRKVVGEQFDDFVKSFKARPAAPPPAPATDRPGAAPAAVASAPAAPAALAPQPAPPPAASARVEAIRDQPARVEAPRADVRVDSSRTAAPAIVPAPSPPAAPPPAPVAPTIAPPPRRAAVPAARTSRSTRATGKVVRKSGTSVVVLLALLLLAAGIAAWFFWPRIIGEHRTETATAPATTPPAPVTQPAGPAAQAPQPAAPAVPADPTVLTTTRAVWLRVIADGRNVLERELPAGARFPFAAEKSVVIRTGDAGAVNLTLNGKDLGPLGREGQVVTRTFSVGQ